MALLRRVSVSVLIPAAIALPLVAVSIALIVLAGVSGNRIAEDMGDELLTSSAQRLEESLSRQTGAAERVADRYARRVGNGTLSARGDLSNWKAAMFEDLALTPEVASICYGNIAGDAVYLQRNAYGILEFGLGDGTKDCATVETIFRPSGEPMDSGGRTYRYDPRARPWYKAAVEAGGATWTPVYFWFGDAGGDATTGTGFTQPILDADGKLLGVLTVDITLNQLGSFLGKLPIAQHGDVFVVDAEGLLVAAAHGRVTTADGRRLGLQNAGGSMSAAAAALGMPPVPRMAPGDRMNRVATLRGVPSRVRASRAQPGRGLDWMVVATLPESEFMGNVRGIQRLSLALAAAAVAIAVGLGFLLARRMTTPLLALASHARRIGSGDLETTLFLSAARELVELGDDLNRMAAGIKQRIELERTIAVAAEVQQSLLPAKDPSIPGLDIAGRCRYCDAAGGDYLDYVTVESEGKSRTLLVVADVMGHGIPAALLMASVRAALRALAPVHSDLGHLMTALNAVIANDNRHERFATTLILELDPDTGVARWACGGHDPAILFDPATGTFAELEGGELPVGMMEGIEYREYRRDGLRPGMVLVVGTDGVWEGANSINELFGKDRLREVIRAGAGDNCAGIAKAIESSLAAFMGAAKTLDDVTFLVVKIGADSRAAESVP